jgi:hypothetical protein
LAALLCAALPGSSWAAITNTASVLFQDTGGLSHTNVSNTVVITVNAPPPPSLTGLSPIAATINDPPTTLTVNGSSFVSGAVVSWNGVSHAATFVNATQLTTTIPSGDLTSLGSFGVTVTNPGSGPSTSLPFSVVAVPGVPQFTNLPANGILTLTSVITVSATGNPSGFNWSFTPLPNVSGSPGIFGSAGAISRALANNPTTAPSIALSSVSGLTAGSYQVSVYSQNLAGRTSAPAQANITILAPGSISVLVHPNPWRGNRDGGTPITFANLMGNSTVKIFTISGHLVKTLSTSSSSVGWDLTNDSGDRVASGFYVYLVANDQDQRARGQVAIIK